jgi:hypothetical protein
VNAALEQIPDRSENGDSISEIIFYFVVAAFQLSSAMTKKKKGSAPNLKLGAPEHFTGVKLAFLTSKSVLYSQCQDLKATATFYDRVTLDFIAKYGEEEPFNKEFAEDPPDPEDIDQDDNIQPPPSKEEAAASAVLFSKLRTVSNKQLKTNLPDANLFPETWAMV